jgi:membrane-bound metal-dependent hydrolase YbcI (DUF457 family)
MTGPTHRQYSICFAMLSLMFIYVKGVSEINYYILLPIMMMAGKVGSLFPDVDHHWANVKDKTVVNKIINTFIHMTGGKHRSWQTHSIDICAYFTVIAFYLPKLLEKNKVINSVDSEVLLALLMAFASGWISHLFSDMLTSAGVRLFCFMKFKVKFVPKKLGPVRFNTGNGWEEFNYKFLRCVNVLLGIFTLAFPYIHNNLDKFIK